MGHISSAQEPHVIGGSCIVPLSYRMFSSLIDILGHPIYGVPTIRSDIPAPRIRRISDRTNYGEEGTAYSLLHPTIFSQKGVFERDFFKTRSKKEVQHTVSKGLKEISTLHKHTNIGMFIYQQLLNFRHFKT